MIRPRRGVDARHRTTLYLLLAPFLLGVLVLVILPVALSIGLAFTAYDGLSAPEWRGLGNFREPAADPLFQSHPRFEELPPRMKGRRGGPAATAYCPLAM